MIRASIFFFVFSLVAYFLGANQIAGISIEIGRVLLYFFLALSIVSMLIALFSDRKPKMPQL
jgi:uncharacterized membrane protein YtjA (UPF0391 family)